MHVDVALGSEKGKVHTTHILQVYNLAYVCIKKFPKNAPTSIESLPCLGGLAKIVTLPLSMFHQSPPPQVPKPTDSACALPLSEEG